MEVEYKIEIDGWSTTMIQSYYDTTKYLAADVEGITTIHRQPIYNIEKFVFMFRLEP